MKDLKKFLEYGRPVNLEECRKQMPTGGKVARVTSHRRALKNSYIGSTILVRVQAV